MMSTQTNQENIAPKAVNYHFCLFSVVLLVANRLLVITIQGKFGLDKMSKRPPHT